MTLPSNPQPRHFTTIIHARALLLLLALSVCGVDAAAQSVVASGFLSGQLSGASSNGYTYLLLNEYDLHEDWEEEDGEEMEEGMLVYNQLPIDAEAQMGSKMFRMHLYCLDARHRVLWSKEMGRTDNSRPFPICVDDSGNVYAGSNSDEERLVVKSFDPKGKERLSVPIDSGYALNGIILDVDTLTVLASSSRMVSIPIDDSSVTFQPFREHKTYRIDVPKGSLKKSYRNPEIGYMQLGGFTVAPSLNAWIHILYQDDTIGLAFGWDTLAFSWELQKMAGTRIMAAGGDPGGLFFVASDPKSGGYRLYKKVDWFKYADSGITTTIPPDDAFGFPSMFAYPTGGISIAFLGPKWVQLRHYDGMLRLVDSSNTDLAKLKAATISHIHPRDRGGYEIVYFTQKKNLRTASILSIDEKGRVMKE